MDKHTQTIRRQFANELFGVFDHVLKLALKGLSGIAALFWLSLLQRDNDLIRAIVFPEVKKTNAFFAKHILSLVLIYQV